MNQHPFDTLPLSNGGTLFFTPCPGTKEVDVASSVAQLKQAGAKAIITLMPTAELSKEGATLLPHACEQAGLLWFHLPIEDDSAPLADFEAAWSTARQQVLTLLAQGGTIAVHCKGGSGRTGLMIAIILLALKTPLDDAIQQVKNIRPKALSIPAHIEYLQQIYS